MLSAVIPSEHSYSALLLAEQQIHQRFVHPGPLVLGTASIKSPTPAKDRDATVPTPFYPLAYSFSCEQPHPWDTLDFILGVPC